MRDKLFLQPRILCLVFCTLFFTSSLASPQTTQSAEPPAPLQLVESVVAHAALDRAQEGCWQYRVEKTVDTQTTSAVQIETKDGPVYRVLAINGKPLDENQRRNDDARLQQLVEDPSLERSVKQKYDQDIQRLNTITQVLPKAFVYQYDSMEGGNVRLKFQPNPDFSPPTYETRALHSMAGTVLIDPKQNKIVRIQGALIGPVDFGFGILGRLDQGGTFQVERTPVAPPRWRTSLIDIHVTGRMILFKTLSKQEHEVRSEFQPVSCDTTLQQGIERLLK